MNVLVADHHEIVRCGMRVVIERIPGFRVCGEAGTARDAIALSRATCPDLAVIDFDLPDGNGIEVAQAVTRLLSSVRVLVLSSQLPEQARRTILNSGALGYARKGDGIAELVRAI